jgi:hypothetical protein
MIGKICMKGYSVIGGETDRKDLCALGKTYRMDYLLAKPGETSFFLINQTCKICPYDWLDLQKKVIYFWQDL